MPKPGWAVSTRVGPLAEPTTSHGKTVAEGVLEITWTARSPADYLPDAFYDEFVFNLKGVSKRAAFVLDEEQNVIYAQVLESAGDLPDFNAIREVLSK